MKKVKLGGKLSLDKETIATLNNSHMNQIVGGVKPDQQGTGSTSGCGSTCDTSCPPPPPLSSHC